MRWKNTNGQYPFSDLSEVIVTSDVKMAYEQARTEILVGVVAALFKLWLIGEGEKGIYLGHHLPQLYTEFILGHRPLG